MVPQRCSQRHQRRRLPNGTGLPGKREILRLDSTIMKLGIWSRG